MQKRSISWSLSVAAAVLHLCLAADSTVAQQNNLSRDLEPIIIKGADLADFAGAPLDELFLYSYDNQGNSWQQIPFQIDEIGPRNEGGSSYFVPDDDLLDDDDDISFMAKDGGDLAESSWPSDASSQGFKRYEIVVTNPLNPSESAWVYLFRSTSLTVDPTLDDYVDWSESANAQSPGEDAIRSRFYEIEHGANGLPANLLVTQAGGGNGTDILDRFKFRALVPFLGATLTLNENTIQFLEEENDSVRVVDGRIRVIREFDASINLLGANEFSSPPLFYYPYSIEFDLRVPSVAGLLTELSGGRLSLDLNGAAAGMRLVSANNPEPGFSIDGNPDTINGTVDNVLPSGNWVYINGQQGTIVHLFPLGLDVGDARLLYYKDDSSQDGDDTGDGQSFGDTGIEIQGNIALPVTLSYRGYFLASSHSSQIGADIAAYEANKLASAFSSQTFDEVTSVRSVDEGELPATFALFQNHPNPFNPSTEIRYRISENFEGNITLKIYNLLGQEVRTLVDGSQNRGTHTVRWDGADNRGRQLGSGVYVYRLHAGDLTESRKMLLIR